MMNQPKDLPNFAAWSNKNLADFCAEAYIRMQEQQEEIEHLKLDAKAALEAARKAMVEGSK
jgi:hypothetical protein